MTSLRAGRSSSLRARRRRALLFSAAASIGGLVLLVSACGGSSDQTVAKINSNATTTSSAPAATTSNGTNVVQHEQLELLAFSKCMRQHGIPSFPDPQQNTDGSYGFANVSKLRQLVRGTHNQDAFTTCEPDLAKAGIASPQNAPQFEQDMLVYAKCMRSHGVPNFPDPNSNGRFGGQLQNLDTNSPSYLTAKTTCSPYLATARNLFTIPAEGG